MATFFDLLTPPLLAYIDLGTGSMLLQVMAAGIFSGLYLVKTNFASLKGYLRGHGRKHA
jgi:hypothetical protein